jgi:hypothetical protein
MPLFIAGCIASAFVTLSTTAEAGPRDGRFRGGNFRSAFVARNSGMSFRNGNGVRRNFGFNRNRRFFRRNRGVAFQQFAWPAYWYPYGYPYDYSYLDDGPDNDFQYGDSGAAAVQPQSSRHAADRPIVIIVNKDAPSSSGPSPAAAPVNSGYNSPDAAWQQRRVAQDPNEKFDPQMPADPRPSPAAVAPLPVQTPPKGVPAAQVRAGAFGNLVLVSWLQEAGKDVIYVQNIETNDVQKITSKPNLENFRIVEVHPDPDPKQFEAVISNGNQQGPVRFRF